VEDEVIAQPAYEGGIPSPELTGLAKYRDAFVALGSVIIYIGFGCSYYSTKGEVPWSLGEVVYFTMATITTVGYGDYNGSDSPSAMIFTCVYAYMGVGIVSLAIGELLETAHEIRMQAQRAALEKMAADLKHTSTIDESKNEGIVKKFMEWAQKNALTRWVIVLLPMAVISLIGVAILVATEPPDSDIMETENPLTTCFYISVITGLSVGYGDFYPTTPQGRTLFTFYMVIAVAVVVSCVGQMAVIVRVLRTSTTSEVVDIQELMLMDESGEGVIDEREYTMHMLKLSGQVDYGIIDRLEQQFKALDVSGDGTLSMEDFPVGMGLVRRHHVFNGKRHEELEVKANVDTSAFPPRTAVAKHGNPKGKPKGIATMHTLNDGPSGLMPDSCPVPAVAKPVTTPEMAGLVGPAAVSGAELAIEAEPEAEGAPPAPEGVQGSDLKLAKDFLHPRRRRQTPARTPRNKSLGGGAQQVVPDPEHAMASVVSFTPAAVEGSTPPQNPCLRPPGRRTGRDDEQEYSPTPDAARPGAEGPFRRRKTAGQAGLQVGGCLAVEFDEGIWDYGKITQVGVAPARRGHSSFEPLRAGHVSAEVAFLDGEVEWHDFFGNFDLDEGQMDVWDGWVPCRFVAQREYSRRHRHEPPAYLLADAAMVPLSSRVLV
jgi:hypothetical protein